MHVGKANYRPSPSPHILPNYTVNEIVWNSHAIPTSHSKILDLSAWNSNNLTKIKSPRPTRFFSVPELISGHVRTRGTWIFYFSTSSFSEFRDTYEGRGRALPRISPLFFHGIITTWWYLGSPRSIYKNMQAYEDSYNKQLGINQCYYISSIT